jgi:hypothetical protein
LENATELSLSLSFEEYFFSVLGMNLEERDEAVAYGVGHVLAVGVAQCRMNLLGEREVPLPRLLERQMERNQRSLILEIGKR